MHIVGVLPEEPAVASHKLQQQLPQQQVLPALSMTSAVSVAPPGRLPTQPKLRRKAPISDTLSELTAVQRLVEYFVVVSSQPMWEEKEPEPPVERPTSRRSAFRRPLLSSRRRLSDDKEPTLETRQESASSESEKSKTTGNIHLPDPTATSEYQFRPTVTARYPMKDHVDNPLNTMITQFCHPSTDAIVPTKTFQMPRVHHFVLTNERGRKVYGTCLTVMEEYIPKGKRNPWARLTMESEDADDSGTVEVSVDAKRRKKLYIPKVLCLLSTWPYLTAFREYLAQLYRLATATDTMTAPIERYIVNVCCEIPAPPPGAYEVQVSILDSTIRFWAPPAKLPISYVALPYQILFECLDLDNVLRLWSAMIMERKVLLLSSQYSILTVCAEILCSLLFPLRWSHLYVPLLPKIMCPMLDAPVPYLCGVARENWMHAQSYVSGDTIVVDLDHNTVTFGEMVPPTPPLPLRKWTKLHTTVHETAGHVFYRARGLEREYRAMMAKKPHKRSTDKLRQVTGSSAWIEKLGSLDHAFNLAYTPDSPNLTNDGLPEDERVMWDRVQEAFLRFFVALLKDYRRYLVTASKPASGATTKPSFDRVAFLSSQKVDRAEFLVELCSTQQFDDFLTRRMYSPGEPDLVFFDQSIDAKLNRSKLKLRKVDTPFLQSAKVHKDLKKLSAVEPSGDGLKEYDDGPELKRYLYKAWPDYFAEGLFCEPRPIPKMIAAEFDRQSVLVAKLRSTVVEEEDEDNILDFYGGDYDPSPEVASFTVFFFVYAALVGREWQEYQKKRRLEEAANPRIRSSSRGMSEERDGAAEEIEAVLRGDIEISDTEDMRLNGCLADLSMGLCDVCPEDSLVSLKSAIVYCGDASQELYTSWFKDTADRVAELQLQLSASRDLGRPESGFGMIEYEEAREVANAQLELAFATLSTMQIRSLSADSDAYLSLMEACGRCGDTARALHLIELMRHDGFVADSEVLGCFVSAFAHDDNGHGIDIGSTSNSEIKPRKASESDAYSNFVEKQLNAAKKADRDCDYDRLNNLVSPSNGWKPGCTKDSMGHSFDDAPSKSDASSYSSEWVDKEPSGGAAFLDWFAQNQATCLTTKPQRRRRRKSTKESSSDMAVTDMVSRQLALGESLLDYLYPNLAIDTNSDSCPHCSHVLSETDIVSGWSPCAFTDYTTVCPRCEHRFVPRFVVTCSSASFQGSQGPRTPLYCEFLSPWVVRKELQLIIKGETGISGMLEPTWRSGTDIRATLFWNLMVLCRRYRLPFVFLLQGSFQQNRLILPRMPAEM